MSAIGAGQLKYQWKKDKQDILDRQCTGVENSTLTIISFSHAHMGNYTCTVMDDHRAVESDPAQLFELGKYSQSHTCLN